MRRRFDALCTKQANWKRFGPLIEQAGGGDEFTEHVRAAIAAVAAPLVWSIPANPGRCASRALGCKALDSLTLREMHTGQRLGIDRRAGSHRISQGHLHQGKTTKPAKQLPGSTAPVELAATS